MVEYTIKYMDDENILKDAKVKIDKEDYTQAVALFEKYHPDAVIIMIMVGD